LGEDGTHGQVHLNHLGKADEEVLRDMISAHLRYTNSARAQDILDNWAHYLPKFVKVMPIEYRRVLQSLAAERAKQLEAV
jgi:glutamate synthase (NADPH/NADH) large chain